MADKVNQSKPATDANKDKHNDKDNEMRGIRI